MLVDLSRLPAGTAGWLSLVTYALNLGDLAEVDFLELKGALPFAGRNRKRSAAVLGRAILGMANRIPDLAEKHLGGLGVVLVGIDSSQGLVGAEAVDAAVLRDLIDPIVGEDGPRWDHQYIEHPSGLVLALIVDPPQWGDPIHACRKDFSDDQSRLSIRDGTVFVRAPGMTRQATSHDLAQLALRLVRAAHTGAQASVAYAGSFDRTSRANVRDLIDGMVDHVAEELCKDLAAPTAPAVSDSVLQGILGSAALLLGDERSPAQFRDEVEQWREGCRRAAEDVVMEFLRHTLEHGTFEIRNESERYLENVRVEVTFPQDVTVLMKSETDHCDHGGQFQFFQMMPTRPMKYGSQNPYRLDYSNLARPGSPAALRGSGVQAMEVEARPEGYVVSWYVGDLPPREAVTADEEFVMFTDENLDVHNQTATETFHVPAQSEIVGAWKMTARGVDYVFRGEITITCRQEPGAFALWKRANHD